MPDKDSNSDLTLTERSVLLILMAEAREVPNSYLTNHRRITLDKEGREKLAGRRLISVREESGPRYHLSLGDKGGIWCKKELGADVPYRAGPGGAALYAILALIVPYLERTDATFPDLFLPPAVPQVGNTSPRPKANPTDDIETRIRKAYAELASHAGARIKLADLRSQLGNTPKPDVDRVLIQMNRTPDVNITSESNQKTLTDLDRAAVVRIGNQDRHLIAIGL
jgi:hypothetical protein